MTTPELDSFCGKCGDRMAAGWREEPFCPTCEFPRAVATAPPGEPARAEVDRLRAENERLREALIDARDSRDIAHTIDGNKGEWKGEGEGIWYDYGDEHTPDCGGCAAVKRIDAALDVHIGTA